MWLVVCTGQWSNHFLMWTFLLLWSLRMATASQWICILSAVIATKSNRLLTGAMPCMIDLLSQPVLHRLHCQVPLSPLRLHLILRDNRQSLQLPILVQEASSCLQFHYLCCTHGSFIWWHFQLQVSWSDTKLVSYSYKRKNMETFPRI